MLPYRAYYPHAGMLLPNTHQVAERIIILPTGVHMDEEKIGVIASIFDLLQRNPEIVHKRLTDAGPPR